MAYKLTVDIVDPDDEQIHVTHIFWGKTKAEAEHTRDLHEAACAIFRAADDDDRTVEEGEEIPDDELPEVEIDEEEEDLEEGDDDEDDEE